MPANEPTQDKTGTVEGPTGDELAQKLSEHGLSNEGTADEKRARLAEAGYDPSYELAQKQAAVDAKQRQENPNEPVIRAADPRLGGETFW